MHDELRGGTQGNRLLAALDSAIRTVIDGAIRVVSLRRGTVLYERGDVIDDIYFPHNGVLSCVVPTSDGETAETAIIGREGAFGLHSGLGKRMSFQRVVVQIGGEFSTIPARNFRRVADDISVRDLIGRYTEVLLAEAQQIAACSTLHTAEQRACRWLLQTADRVTSNTLLLTQELLGEMLAVRRTTVNFVFQQLRAKRLVDYRRGQVEIKDRAGLESCSCECYEVIRSDRLPGSIGIQL
jgi:CRP-like cAMP-binding protein